MGYERIQGNLVELFDPDHAVEATRWMAEAGGRFVFEHAVENTPVSYTGLALAIGGFSLSRAPGTLKSRWVMHPVEPASDWVHGGFQVKVENTDPIAPYVEWDTRPHIIVPKKPGGVLRFRVWPTMELVHARIVHHPGTKGQHMMGLALHRAGLEFGEICRPSLERWALTQMAKAAAA